MFFCQAEDGIRDSSVTGVQTCALPILVAGERLAWQQRKAASFTVSALHSGSDDLCYRRSCSFGGEGGISLGTAVAISGAAASPNMGYHSSPALTFIMTLFNARPGSWPGHPKQRRCRED